MAVAQYAEQDWDVESPVQNALGIVRWLRRIGVEPGHIHLFLSGPGDPGAEARALGVEVRPATLDSIDTFLRSELPNAPMGSSLMFYWSGHGITDGHARRILFCSDYSSSLSNRAFNADLLFRQLRTDAFKSFDRLIALLDVCAVKHEAKVQALDAATEHKNDRDHLICFATPEGQYARANSGQGAFTYAALQALAAFDDWPDPQDLFKERLSQLLVQLNLPRFMLSMGGADGGEQALVGRAPEEANPALKALLELIAGSPVELAVVRRHYDATAQQLGNSELLKAQGLTGMVGELGKLTSTQPGKAPPGLVQFVLRLQQEEALADFAAQWLKAYALEMDVTTEQARISRENGRNLLVISLGADDDEQLASVSFSLRSRRKVAGGAGAGGKGAALVQGRAYPARPVTTWKQLEEAVLEVLRDLDGAGLAKNLEVHVLAEPPLFGFPFHQLPSHNRYLTLGKMFVVVVHHTPRVSDEDPPDLEVWRAQAEKLSQQTPAQLAWQELKLTGRLGDDACLWFLASPLKRGKLKSAVKGRLWQLLTHGAPFIYWPHDPLECELGPDLLDMVRQLETLAELPERFRRKRVADDPVALRGSLLWDEPGLELFTVSKGVIQR